MQKATVVTGSGFLRSADGFSRLFRRAQESGFAFLTRPGAVCFGVLRYRVVQFPILFRRRVRVVRVCVGLVALVPVRGGYHRPEHIGHRNEQEDQVGFGPVHRQAACFLVCEQLVSEVVPQLPFEPVPGERVRFSAE